MELTERQPLLKKAKGKPPGSANSSEQAVLSTFGTSSNPILNNPAKSICPCGVFVLLVTLQVLIHYDAGAIPASLGPDCLSEGSDQSLEEHFVSDHHGAPTQHGIVRFKRLRFSSDCGDPSQDKGMIHDFRLGYTEIGLLQSLVYLGLTVSCSFGGSLLQRHKAKWFVAGGLLVDVLCMATLASTYDTTICIVSRFVLGLAQAYLIMFLPVWIDEFSPEGKSTTWMSIAQAGVPVGIMCGYLISGFLAANTSYSWRYSFWLQICFLIPTIVIFICLPARYVNIPCDPEDDSTVQSPYRHHNVFIQIGLQLRAVFQTPLFLLTALSLSALYYVVAALQLWITPYVHGPPLFQPLNTIVVAFSLVSASAPVLGLLTGGWFMDHLFGGYRTCVSQTAQVALLFGVVATLASFLVTITTNFLFFFGLIWTVLFCGAAAVPCCTGISLCSVPKELRPVASSITMMIYNLLGWFAGPLLTGVVASVTGSLTWGFRFTMAWSAVSFICMLGVYYITSRNKDATPSPRSLRLSPTQKETEIEMLQLDMVSIASLSSVGSAPRKHASSRDLRPSSDPGGARLKTSHSDEQPQAVIAETPPHFYPMPR